MIPLATPLAFIGAGRMATALARGVVQGGLLPGDAIRASDPAPSIREQFLAAIPQATVVEANPAAVATAATVVLAVKPQTMAQALEGLADHLRDKLVISIAAGVTLAKLQGWLPEARLVRVMPNTPCLLGKGASGYALGSLATGDDAQVVETLLSAVGVVHRLPESLLDAVTGLSGSGPAFAYTFIEALADGGVLCGLPRDVATSLAAQTVAGAAAMILETGRHPAQLRDEVTSPGGTTIAGLQALEQHGLRAAVLAAVERAAARSRELGSPDCKPNK